MSGIVRRLNDPRLIAAVTGLFVLGLVLRAKNAIR